MPHTSGLKHACHRTDSAWLIWCLWQGIPSSRRPWKARQLNYGSLRIAWARSLFTRQGVRPKQAKQDEIPRSGEVCVPILRENWVIAASLPTAARRAAFDPPSTIDAQPKWHLFDPCVAGQDIPLTPKCQSHCLVWGYKSTCLPPGRDVNVRRSCHIAFLEPDVRPKSGRKKNGS